MIRRPPRSTQSRSSAASDVYKRQIQKLLKSTATSCVECSNKNAFQNIIQANLCCKYRTARKFYNVKVINDIIYNDNTHIVSAFKDFLICDDIEEFLKRYYNSKETTTRLNKIFDFYDKYSKVFPNYVILDAKKYLLKNISRKQRVIDEQQELAEEMEQKKNEDNSVVNPKLLTSTFIRELNSSLSEIGKKAEAAKTQFGSYTKFQPKGDTDKTNDFKDITLKDLLEKFIHKDTMDLNAEIDDFDVSHYTSKERPNTRKVEVQVAPAAEKVPAKGAPKEKHELKLGSRAESSNSKKLKSSATSPNPLHSAAGKPCLITRKPIVSSAAKLIASSNTVRNQAPLYRQSSEATRKVIQSNPRPVTAMQKISEGGASKKKFTLPNNLKTNPPTARNEKAAKSTRVECSKRASSYNKERSGHMRSRSNKDLDQRDDSRKAILKDLLASSLNKPKSKRLTPSSMPQSTKLTNGISSRITLPSSSGARPISTLGKGEVKVDLVRVKDIDALKVDISSLRKEFPELKKSIEGEKKFKSEYLNSLNSKRAKRSEAAVKQKHDKKPFNPVSLKAPKLNHSRSTEALKEGEEKAQLRRVESKVALTNCRTHNPRRQQRQPSLKPRKVNY
eukprot:TRINITY_DN4814_c0_g1_i11.p1 TRINITY_DN4814_c0_g1~~TRINITY_DN4814_c0_g1_i11.p1  ORF type:complete len:627 (+),score=173.02 TRINITY_DN4814_c0_g1_i11:28-1881(+)